MFFIVCMFLVFVYLFVCPLLRRCRQHSQAWCLRLNSPAVFVNTFSQNITTVNTNHNNFVISCKKHHLDFLVALLA